MCEVVDREVKKYTLWWAQDILEELLNLVDVSLDLAIEGYEGWVCAWSQVLEVCRLPGREVKKLQGTVNSNMFNIYCMYM